MAPLVALLKDAKAAPYARWSADLDAGPNRRRQGRPGGDLGGREGPQGRRLRPPAGDPPTRHAQGDRGDGRDRGGTERRRRLDPLPRRHRPGPDRQRRGRAGASRQAGREGLLHPLRPLHRPEPHRPGRPQGVAGDRQGAAKRTSDAVRGEHDLRPAGHLRRRPGARLDQRGVRQAQAPARSGRWRCCRRPTCTAQPKPWDGKWWGTQPAGQPPAAEGSGLGGHDQRPEHDPRRG